MGSQKLCLFLVVLSAVALAVLAKEPRRNYDGYTVLRASSVSHEDFNTLAKLRTQSSYDFWSGPVLGRTADIMVSPGEQAELESFLKSNGISYSPMIKNVGLAIAEEQEAVLASSDPQAAMDWNSYYPLETVYSWLEDLERNYSSVKLINIGKSTEGRDLIVVKISSGGNSTKPSFWIDGTIHAREWIATTTATYVINQLVTSNSSVSAELLSSLDFYILPVVNPDGYEYSRTTDRLWRKTRSILSNTSCIGVDANRNFGYKWESAEESGSTPCSITYPGAYPYSEPETAAVNNYILDLITTVDLQAFITLHSYSQLWMTPWGYTTDLPENYNELMRVANKATAALEAVSGTTYQAGSASNILYGSTGTSRDWAKGVPNITYVYTIELRDTGRYGFVLPPEQIIPTGEETWAGISVAAREVANATRFN